MKRTKFMLPVLSALLILAAFSKKAERLEIGAKAPMTNHEVEDVSGRNLTLQSVAKDNGLLVIFSCNTCPWVAKWEDRYLTIAEQAKENNIGVIALNPNEKIRDKGESMDDMKMRADKKGYTFYYAMDTDHQLADAFGATRTPDVFLFNSNMELVYQGAIDDNADSADEVEESYLENAINELIAGEAVSKTTTRSLGCTIKRTR
ncbi:MAG: redoxin domain-containing protein [Bacteroidota bacterium]